MSLYNSVLEDQQFLRDYKNGEYKIAKEQKRTTLKQFKYLRGTHVSVTGAGGKNTNTKYKGTEDV